MKSIASTERIQVRDIRTPEGVSLPFEVASVADRAVAFALDFVIIHAVVVVVMVLGVLASGAGVGSYGLSVSLLLSFVLRNFYFVFAELRWGGATIGKRRFGLRVIARDGGALTAEAVFARNLTRDLEIFLPLTVLLAPGALLPGLPGWAVLIGTAWLGVFTLLPLFNRDRLRVGDIVAGTLVVRMPKAKLMADLAEFSAAAPSAEQAREEREERYVFTREQLDLYGIKELHVLEDLLRRGQGFKEMELLETVARKIKHKIGWEEEPAEIERWQDTWDFLSAFYKAQRARLEHKMLFGVRQEEKRK